MTAPYQKKYDRWVVNVKGFFYKMKLRRAISRKHEK